MGLTFAVARPQACTRVLGLYAVTQPVSARRRARFAAQRIREPVSVRALRLALRLVAVGDVLCQVFGEVADAPARVL